MKKMDYTESDLLFRVIEPLYDVAWAYHMSSTVDHVAKRMERRRKTFSSTASVVSMATTATTKTETSVSGLSVSDKVVAMENLLHRVSRVMRARQFEDVCRVSLKSSDDLYPGFRDVLFIAQYLMERAEPYMGLLTCDEINGLTLTQVFQYIFYEFCAFLLSGKRVGKEAIKLIITPTKITHAAYDLCRQKFARLLSEETGIVQDGLHRLIDKIKKDRDPDVKETTALMSVPVPVPSPQEVVESIKEEIDVVVVSDKVPLPDSDNVITTASPPTTPLPSDANLNTPKVSSNHPGKSTTSVSSRTITFPVIELSSDDESQDEESVSSLDSEI